jgi:hypothetical protein
MLKLIGTVAGATILLGCASASFADGELGAPAITHTSTASSAPLACTIQAEKVQGGLRLEALVATQHQMAGTYQLTLTKAGPAGSSGVSQGGEFSVMPGTTSVLSGSELTLERGAKLTAKLAIATNQGDIACEAEFEA